MSQRLEIDSEEVMAHTPPPPQRRPIRAVLLFIAVMGLAGGSWWAYRTDTPRLPPSAVPVIHSDTAPVKEAPQDPGGMIVPGQDSALLNRDSKGNPKVEQLLPDAEPALPRPVAPIKPTPQIETNTALTKPTPQVQTAMTPPPPAPSVAVAPPEAAPATPAPTIASAPVASAPSQPVSGAGYRLQLGAVRTEDAAKQEWLRLQRAQSDLLGKLSLTATRVDLGDKGIFYRIQAGPIADGAEAAQSCATLKSRNVGCILVKP
jgi:hypothetical protein